MNFGLLIILLIPPAVNYFRFQSEGREIILEALITLGLLFLGWRVLRLGGCVFRIIGLIMMVLGLAAYYYLIIQPFFTGQIITFGFLK